MGSRECRETRFPGWITMLEPRSGPRRASATPSSAARRRRQHCLSGAIFALNRLFVGLHGILLPARCRLGEAPTTAFSGETVSDSSRYRYWLSRRFFNTDICQRRGPNGSQNVDPYKDHPRIFLVRQRRFPNGSWSSQAFQQTCFRL